MQAYPTPTVRLDPSRTGALISMSRKDASDLALLLRGRFLVYKSAGVSFPSGLKLLLDELDRELTSTPQPASISNARSVPPSAHTETAPEATRRKQNYADPSDINPRAVRPPVWLICPLPGQENYGLTQCVLMRWNGNGYSLHAECVSTKEAQAVIDSVDEYGAK